MISPRTIEKDGQRILRKNAQPAVAHRRTRLNVPFGQKREKRENEMTYNGSNTVNYRAYGKEK